MPNVDLAAIEVDGRDQAVPVSADIEDDQAFHPVSARERLPQIVEAREIGPSDDGIPVRHARAVAGNTIPATINNGAGAGINVQICTSDGQPSQTTQDAGGPCPRPCGGGQETRRLS